MTLKAVQDAVAKGEVVDPSELKRRHGGGGGEGGGPDSEDPDTWPVTPLGRFRNVYYFLDELGQLAVHPASEMTRLNLLSLFGRQHAELYKMWPRFNAKGEPTGGWAPELAQAALMAACSNRGLMSIVDRVREVGAWRGNDDELILHCGDQVFVQRPGGAFGNWLSPGFIDGKVYPAGPPGPHPLTTAAPGGPDGPAAKLLALLNKWAWRRGTTDARLMLGWIAAAMIGGALRWRPGVWVTGERGTGKSTLLDQVVMQVLDQAVVKSSDATGAGIYQHLRQSSRPVILDELEATADLRKVFQVIELARQATSGGVVLRGDKDHGGHEFRAQSSFLFSSVNMPPLLSQDRSRLAILELDKLSTLGRRRPPQFNAAELREVGAALLRRLVDGWARLPDVLEQYREQLQALGHDARGADQFGTLLATAAVVIDDHPPDGDTLAAETELLEAAHLAELEDTRSSQDSWLGFLLTQRTSDQRGVRSEQISALIARAAQRSDAATELSVDDCCQMLARIGLRVKADGGNQVWLAVANNHAGLERLMLGSDWQGRSGASVAQWVQEARRLPGAVRGGQVPGLPELLKFANYPSRATYIPLATIFPD